jgi:hypothetical protein
MAVTVFIAFGAFMAFMAFTVFIAFGAFMTVVLAAALGKHRTVYSYPQLLVKMAASSCHHVNQHAIKIVY